MNGPQCAGIPARDCEQVAVVDSTQHVRSRALSCQRVALGTRDIEDYEAGRPVWLTS